MEPPTSTESLHSALPDTTELATQFPEGNKQAINSLPANWIQAFNDTQLESIVDEVLNNNLDLQAAAAQVSAASSLARQAGAELKPYVTLSGELLEQTDMDTEISSSPQSLSLSISWEADIWGRVRSQKAAAKASYESTLSNFEFARLSLKAQTAKIWFSAVEIRNQLAFAQEIVDLNEKTLEIVNLKYEYGETDMRAVHLSRADLASAKDRMKQLDTADRKTRRALEVLLGRYPSAELGISDELVAVPPRIPTGLPSELLERRPDLISAERQVAAAFHQIDSAKAARLPRISLTAGIGLISDQLANALGAGDSYWSAGSNFLAPIFYGGALKANVEIATAEQKAALANYGKRALTAFSEVENALDNEKMLAEREALLEEIVSNNRSAYELAEAQYEAGAIELLDLLQLQQRLVSSQVSLINMRSTRLSNRVDLHLALGGDFSNTK